MIATIDTRKSGRWLSILALVVTLGVAGPALAQDPPAHDLLNAVLWMQRSVEYKAHALGAFALARIRLEQALADPSWTAAPREQTGAYQWIMLANPSYGSFESAPYGHDFKKSEAEKRKAKRGVLDAWPGP